MICDRLACRVRVCSLILLALFLRAREGFGQNTASLSIILDIDYGSAERTIEVYQGSGMMPREIAGLRGSRIALATTSLVTQRHLDLPTLERHLEAAKYNQRLEDDPFLMVEARGNAQPMKELLRELQRRNFGQRVVSTVEQLFPSEARVSSRLPMFFVAFGPQQVDAFVRRVIWDGPNPRFVGEGEGELTIVVNLAHAVSYGSSTDERFIGVLSVVAHEVFHAAFGAYKDTSPAWRRYYATYTTPFDNLLDLAHNEGIAYYLSLVQRTHGRLTPEWEQRLRSACETFNRNADELLSPGLTERRAFEILRLANTSGYWESFGSMAGMVIARQIDQTLGRTALSETIATGPHTFFRTYAELMKRDSNLPQLSAAVVRALR